MGCPGILRAGTFWYWTICRRSSHPIYCQSHMLHREREREREKETPWCHISPGNALIVMRRLLFNKGLLVWLFRTNLSVNPVVAMSFGVRWFWSAALLTASFLPTQHTCCHDNRKAGEKNPKRLYKTYFWRRKQNVAVRARGLSSRCECVKVDN